MPAFCFNPSPYAEKEFHIIKEAGHTFMEDTHLSELKTILDNWLKNINGL
jgi:hypothetical protein